MQHLDQGFERVFTVINYYDGPREGIANFRDRPHLYRCQWDEDADEYASTYLLSPVPSDLFLGALEDWQIWLRWERAFHEGRVTRESHPALPEDRARHEALDAILKKELIVDPALQVQAIGEFKPIVPAGPGGRGPGMVAMQVRWSIVPAG